MKTFHRASLESLLAAGGAAVLLTILLAVPAYATSDLNTVIDSVRNWVAGLLAALASFFLTIGAARYLTANGNPQAVEEGEAAIKSSQAHRPQRTRPVSVDRRPGRRDRQEQDPACLAGQRPAWRGDESPRRFVHGRPRRAGGDGAAGRPGVWRRTSTSTWTSSRTTRTSPRASTRSWSSPAATTSAWCWRTSISASWPARRARSWPPTRVRGSSFNPVSIRPGGCRLSRPGVRPMARGAASTQPRAVPSCGPDVLVRTQGAARSSVARGPRPTPSAPTIQSGSSTALWSDAAGHAMWLKSRSRPGWDGSVSTTVVQRPHCDALSGGVRCGVRHGARCSASYGAGPRNSRPTSTCARTVL